MPKSPRLKKKSISREALVLLVTILLIAFLHLRGGQSSSPHQRDSNVASTQLRLLLGVVTLWDKIERRNLIRQMYPLSLTNSPTPDDVVRTIFVIGEPKSDTARAVLEWESKTFGDILILDGVDENMNAGKTYQFLKVLHDWRILYQDGGWTHVGKVDDDTW
jgi:hypothetical protein